MAAPSNTNPQSSVRKRSRIGRFFGGLASDLGEASICMGLGMRTALAPGLLSRSALLGSVLGGFWLWLFWHYLAKIAGFSVAGASTLVMGLIVPFGGITQYALVNMPAPTTTNNFFGSVGPSSYNAGVQLFNLGSIMVYVFALAAVVMVLLWAMAYLVSTGLASRALFWQRLRDATRRNYPALQESSSPGPDVGLVAPRRMRRAALVIGLFVPFVSGVLLIGLICYAIVRLFFGSLMGDWLTPGQRSVVLRQCVGASVALGAMMLLLALVPLLNLLIPVLWGTAAGHMYYRAAARMNLAARTASAASSPSSLS